jgi:hypothetical protein
MLGYLYMDMMAVCAVPGYYGMLDIIGRSRPEEKPCASPLEGDWNGWCCSVLGVV